MHEAITNAVIFAEEKKFKTDNEKNLWSTRAACANAGMFDFA